jgi:hypothetical protein
LLSFHVLDLIVVHLLQFLPSSRPIQILSKFCCYITSKPTPSSKSNFPNRRSNFLILLSLLILMCHRLPSGILNLIDQRITHVAGIRLNVGVRFNVDVCVVTQRETSYHCIIPQVSFFMHSCRQLKTNAEASARSLPPCTLWRPNVEAARVNPAWKCFSSRMQYSFAALQVCNRLRSHIRLRRWPASIPSQSCSGASNLPGLSLHLT